mgnify:CR=1 FL=1
MLRNMVTFLMKNPIASQFDLSSIENVIYGIAPVGSEEVLKNKFNFKYIQQVYASTETLYNTITDPDNKEEGTCGTPLPGMEMKVV